MNGTDPREQVPPLAPPGGFVAAVEIMSGGNVRLTRRQRQVVVMLCDGASYAKIARTLGIKERTVRMHVEHVAAHLDGDAPPLRRVLQHAGRLLAA